MSRHEGGSRGLEQVSGDYNHNEPPVHTVCGHSQQQVVTVMQHDLLTQCAALVLLGSWFLGPDLCSFRGSGSVGLPLVAEKRITLTFLCVAFEETCFHLFRLREQMSRTFYFASQSFCTFILPLSVLTCLGFRRAPQLPKNTNMEALIVFRWRLCPCFHHQRCGSLL